MRRQALTGLAVLVLAAGWVPAHAGAAGVDPAQEEVIARLRDCICAGYRERNPEKILSAYDAGAQVATFMAGVLSRDDFARLVGEDVGRYETLEADLQIGEVAVAGDEAKVALQMTLSGVLAGGEKKVRSDRLYFVLKRQGSWRILIQTYRKDFSLPTAAPVMKMH